MNYFIMNPYFYLVFICWRKCRERNLKKIEKIKKRKIRLCWILNPSSPIWVEWNSQLFLQFSNWCALVRISLSFDCYMLLHFSRQAGHRVGEHLERIIPMIVQYSRVENDDELREYCIQVSRNPFFELPACKTVPLHVL